jgi:nucleotide-binding universal stress UspA family protein
MSIVEERLESDVDRLLAGERSARKAAPRAAEPQLAAFRRIVVGIDGTPASEAALAWTGELARSFYARVWVANVVPPPDAYEGAGVAGLYDAKRELAEEVLHAAAEQLERTGVGAETVLREGEPGRQLARVADEQGADLVVVGSHGRGALARAVAGSVGEGLRVRSATSVLVARGEPPAPHVLVAADGSRSARRAGLLALRLAQGWNASATALHVVPPPSIGPLERRAFQHAFAGLQLAPWSDPRVRFDVQFGDPAERILAEAERRGAGLVALGSQGLGRARRLLTGSVGAKVLRRARASVLVVREPAASKRA